MVEAQRAISSLTLITIKTRFARSRASPKALASFVGAIRDGLDLGAPRGVVAVDGKPLRKAYERGRACAPPLMVSVWDAETRVSIAAARAPGGNEVAATLALLKTLVLKGCIVTADALHCHPRMAEGVLASGADYALGLKGNHGPLHAGGGSVARDSSRETASSSPRPKWAERRWKVEGAGPNR